MRKLSIFERYWKGRREVIEKPGESTHSAKWDRCVQHIKDKGGNYNAYAVCTAMLGDESFKSMNDDDFMKEVDIMLRKLGISGAGAVPNSLLSMQDLEPREKVQKDRQVSEDSDGPHGQPSHQKSMGVCVYWKDAKGNRQNRDFLYQADADAYVKLLQTMNFGYTGIGIEKSHNLESEKAMGMYVVRSNNMEYGRFNNAEDARDCIDNLGMQGVFATLIRESMMKGAIEQTGKQLDRAAAKAEDAETPSEKKSVAENIKAIQIKRQRATIEARSKSMTGKTFNEVWQDNKKPL